MKYPPANPPIHKMRKDSKIHIVRKNTNKLLCSERNTLYKVKVTENSIVQIHHEKMWCRRCLERYRKRWVIT